MHSQWQHLRYTSFEKQKLLFIFRILFIIFFSFLIFFLKFTFRCIYYKILCYLSHCKQNMVTIQEPRTHNSIINQDNEQKHCLLFITLAMKRSTGESESTLKGSLTLLATCLRARLYKMRVLFKCSIVKSCNIAL